MIDIGADIRNLVLPECLKENPERVETEEAVKKPVEKTPNKPKVIATRRRPKFKQPPRNRRGARV